MCCALLLTFLPFPSISVLTCALRQIEHHPRFAQLLEHRPFIRQHTSLGMFGSASAKPVKLFSSSNFIRFLYRKLNRVARGLGPSNTTQRYVRNGRTYFSGTRHLRASQVYPAAFGRQARSQVVVMCSRFGFWHRRPLSHAGLRTIPAPCQR